MENKSDTTREFTLRFLQDITNNFSQEHIIGSGGYGVVYRGVLENGEEIAIKKLHYMPGLDDTQFRNEFNNLIRVQHRNITRLVGYCYHLGHELIMYNGEYVFAHVEERALCFEYLQNGSLDKYISDESGGLDWRARYKIIKGVCKGLNYLHNGYKDPIYHLDLKPANILLDKDMTPKIGDFGLSRLFPSAHTYTTIKIIGTPGYMPPEYIEKYEITSKFDVFSLGVIIIRIIAGDEGYSKRANMSSQEFVKDVHENWQKRMGEITTSRTSLEVRTCIEIALRCVEADRMRRPTISEIFIELNEIDTVDSSPISQGAEDMEDDSGFEYSDDEPIVAPPCSETRVQLMIKKYSNEVPLHENRKKVMLQLTRGASVGRLGLDMVIVLDISGSMQGKKIQEMKTTTKFIINKLSHIDRLSIVTFSVVAARLCPLRLITESSQFELQGLIDSLTASGDTANIIDGLQIGLKVLADRKVSRGRVVAVMIMSDGLQISRGSQVDIDCNNVPVYTFGFGDRDPMVLHEVADKSNGGTFSAMIQDMDGLSFAFSRCLDSLLTIVVQDLRLTVQSVKEEFIILIKVITDGSHTQAQDAHHGSVTVSLGDLSIRDVHNVTVDLDLPATKSECSTDILKITYSYSTFGELFVAPPFTMTVWRTSIPPYSYKYPDRPPIMAWPAGDKYAVLIKLLLVGDSGVGKSTLLLQFTDGSFSPSFISTIRTIELDNRQVELQVWDTAGQECFQTITTDRVQTITTGFYRTGILFVYDVTNESSFNNVRVWYRKIKEHSPYVNKILVGNRSDMDESKRAVTTSRGQALADEYGIRFFETSAKTYLNVEEVFLSLARDVIHRYNYWS